MDLGFLYFCLLNLATPSSPRNVIDLKGSGGGSALLWKFPREGQGTLLRMGPRQRHCQSLPSLETRIFSLQILISLAALS